MSKREFWDELEKPIIGLAPMDGVTDAAFRYIVCKYSRPSLTITEFTNVEGLARGATKMLTAFLYNEIERPVVGQIYGTELESFYKCSLMLCALGFDGIDINMGCPVNKVARHGSGAGLIKTPELAKKIIRIVKKAAKDWADGITLEKAKVPEEIISEIEKMNLKRPEGFKIKRQILPVSIKTRIGFDEIVVEEWINYLLEEKPANITLHGRTLKQLYMGKANWEQIGKAAKICRGSATTLLGNGDIESMDDGKAKIKTYGVDGVLVGRAVQGNPYFFNGKEPSSEERLMALIEHVSYFDGLNHLHFYNLRKHLGWYCKGFDGARDLRKKMMEMENASEVIESLKSELKMMRSMS